MQSGVSGACEYKHVGCEGACVISVQMVAEHQDIEEHRLEGVVTMAALGTKYEIERGCGGKGGRERDSDMSHPFTHLSSAYT